MSCTIFHNIYVSFHSYKNKNKLNYFMKFNSFRQLEKFGTLELPFSDYLKTFKISFSWLILLI